MWAEAVAAIARGLMDSVLHWWATFRQGVLKQKYADASATLQKEHDIDKQVGQIAAEEHRDFYIADDGSVHRVRGQRTTPDLRGRQEP